MPIIETKGAASSQGFGQFASTGEAVYIESVFQTWLYTGNGSTQTITTGIDLAGKGGMLWIKSRSQATNHIINDTARGAGNNLMSNSTSAQFTNTDNVSALSSTGFSVGVDSNTNGTAGATYASWTFRKQPKFFDVVTYTGDGANNKTISHALGSTPGCIIVKRTDNIGGWVVYHRGTSVPNNTYLTLQTTNAATNLGVDRWSVTGTTFNANNNDLSLNESGATYVAYLFAHNAGGFGLTGTDNVISCGAWTDSGSGTQTITLGYEPQFVIYKRTDASSNWVMLDNMRGWPVVNASGSTANLYPNLSNAESGGNYGGNGPTATGFNMPTLGGGTYIYIAIRRGPMKTPTTGTSVFETLLDTAGTGTLQTSTASFPLDMQFNTLYSQTNATYNNQINDRLRGIGFEPSFSSTPKLTTASTAAEDTSVAYLSFKGNGRDVTKGSGWGSTVKALFYNFRRAPGFFDVVCYTGTGSARTLSHNLTVAPELMILKARSEAEDWSVFYNFGASSATGLVLQSTAASFGVTYASNGTLNGQPTASSFFLGSNTGVNKNTITYVAYLFASVAGVSKVGSYTGTGALQTINCGFTGGARFVLIKRTDSTGDWFVYDSARGISSGNDPYLLMNSTAAEVTGTNYVDTTSVGFQVTAAAPAGLNANGGTYIFLAIA